MSQFLKEKNPEAIFLAEADVKKDQINRFFDHGERMQTMFNFQLNNKIFYALVKEDPLPLIEQLKNLPNAPAKGQWINFLRNLDELNLMHLPKTQYHEVMDSLAPKDDMRIYDRGIRRRFAPMFPSLKKQKLAYSLIFSLPGSLLIVYGEEIGMSEKLSMQGRTSVRTIMQWNNQNHGGFSPKPELELKNLVTEGRYGYKNLNVENEQNSDHSLLHHIKNLCAVRKQHPEIGLGQYEIFDLKNKKVLGVKIVWNQKTLYLVHNFTNQKKQIILEDYETLEILLSDSEYQFKHKSLMLKPYGFLWLESKTG